MLPRKETKQSPSVWFKSAADAEYDIAQYNTTLYYRVHCNSTDITDIHEAYSRAIYWYKKSANQRDADV